MNSDPRGSSDPSRRLLRASEGAFIEVSMKTIEEKDAREKDACARERIAQAKMFLVIRGY